MISRLVDKIVTLVTKIVIMVMQSFILVKEIVILVMNGRSGGNMAEMVRKWPIWCHSGHFGDIWPLW